jgi:uncharacterized Zn finger protein (UPF0148 family)
MKRVKLTTIWLALLAALSGFVLWDSFKTVPEDVSPDAPFFRVCSQCGTEELFGPKADRGPRHCPTCEKAGRGPAATKVTSLPPEARVQDSQRVIQRVLASGALGFTLLALAFARRSSGRSAELPVVAPTSFLTCPDCGYSLGAGPDRPGEAVLCPACSCKFRVVPASDPSIPVATDSDTKRWEAQLQQALNDRFRRPSH